MNGTRLEVGNCCINQISDEFDPLKRIFPALRDGRINPAVIIYAFRQNIINVWEKNFLQNVWRKRNRSYKQENVFNKIREKIYDRIKISPEQRQKIYSKWTGYETDGHGGNVASFKGVRAL